MEAKCMARGTAGAGERRVQEKRRVQGNGGSRGTAGADELHSDRYRGFWRFCQNPRYAQRNITPFPTVGNRVFAKTHGTRSAVPPLFLPWVIAILPKPTVRMTVLQAFC